MSLESPRELRFEGANAPGHRRPRAPNGSTVFDKKTPNPALHCETNCGISQHATLYDKLMCSRINAQGLRCNWNIEGKTASR